jgi:integrase
LNGRKHREPLGAVSAITLAAARKAAADIMGRVARGENPAEVRKVETAQERTRQTRDMLTFGRLIDDWYRLHLNVNRRPRYAEEARRALRFAFADALRRPAEALTRAVVVPILDDLPRAMGARTAAYGRACFGWGIKRGVLAGNPFDSVPLPSNAARERVLSDDELAAIWKAAEADQSRFGALVRLLILTGQRREEAGGMAWAELSDDRAVWTLPPSRTKNGRAHIVPLAEPARAILGDVERVSSKVFGAPGSAARPFSGWSKAKRRLDAASGVKDWRVHDIRRTVATGMQRMGVRLEVTEAILNHTGGTRAGIVGVYQRHTWAEEKRSALDAWAVHVIGLAAGDAIRNQNR